MNYIWISYIRDYKDRHLQYKIAKQGPIQIHVNACLYTLATLSMNWLKYIL
jgi:hypothetical protein